MPMPSSTPAQISGRKWEKLATAITSLLFSSAEMHHPASEPRIKKGAVVTNTVSPQFFPKTAFESQIFRGFDKLSRPLHPRWTKKIPATNRKFRVLILESDRNVPCRDRLLSSVENREKIATEIAFKDLAHAFDCRSVIGEPSHQRQKDCVPLLFVSRYHANIARDTPPFGKPNSFDTARKFTRIPAHLDPIALMAEKQSVGVILKNDFHNFLLLLVARYVFTK
jgi:hypothetical protein